MLAIKEREAADHCPSEPHATQSKSRYRQIQQSRAPEMKREPTLRNWGAAVLSPSDVVERAVTLFPVSLIATFDSPETPLRVIPPDITLAELRLRKDLEPFDWLPVKRGNEFAGLLNKADTAILRASGRRPVKDYMLSLDSSRVIEASTPLLTFLQGALEIGCRLIRSSNRICGIVTLSDIQKLPVRGLLWLLLTHYELLLAEIIRAERHTDPVRIDNVLQDYDTIQKEWSKRQASDFAVDEIAVTTLFQKELILRRVVPDLFTDATSEALKEIRALRDRLAHAHPFANSPSSARLAIQRLHLCQQWIVKLESKLTSIKRTYEPPVS